MKSLLKVLKKMKLASENNEENSNFLSVPGKLFNTNEKKYHALYRNNENVKFL